MTKITLRRIFSKHVLLKRTQFQLTQAQLAEAVGTSHGWIQKIESGKKMPGFFLAIKLAVFLEIDMNSFLKDLMEASGTPITASKRQESLDWSCTSMRYLRYILYLPDLTAFLLKKK